MLSFFPSDSIVFPASKSLSTSMASSAFLRCAVTSSSTPSFSATKLHPITPPLKPINLTMFPKQSNSASIQTYVETHIEKTLPRHQPASVFEPMYHLTFSPPPSMAPALCIAACEIVGGKKHQAISTASALHLMHAAAFTHENLPLSDRPCPKLMASHTFAANIQLLTGDGMLPFAFELLGRLDASTCPSNKSEQILRVIIEIAHATGSQGVVDGQYQKMQCMGTDDCETLGWVNYVCEKKEGGFYGCGAACGAILGGGTNEEIEILRRFGFYVGMMHGMLLHGTGLSEKKRLEEAQGFRSLALKELELFKNNDVETISCLVDECFTTALNVV